MQHHTREKTTEGQTTRHAGGQRGKREGRGGVGCVCESEGGEVGAQTGPLQVVSW